MISILQCNIIEISKSLHHSGELCHNNINLIYVTPKLGAIVLISQK